MRRKGRIFTLIELLIVVAIIAILAALLLPALNQARNKSKSLHCLNTIKQLAMYTQLYCDESGGFMFPYTEGSWRYNQTGFANWLRQRQGIEADWNTNDAALAPYGKKWGLFCSDDHYFQCNRWSGPSPVWKASYIAPTDFCGVKVDKLNPPSIKVQWVSCGINSFINKTHNPVQMLPLFNEGRGFHDGTIQTAFFDGHAEKIKFGDFAENRISALRP
jgi:prepilin-type N-terminal cleavage/methylation domain-containing protein/prepilin-type processing-associated H-X9-DG protein